MSDPNENKKNLNNFAKYSGIGFQMLATIGLFAFIGYKLDGYKGNKSLIFTALFSVAGVGLSLYQVVKQLNKNEK